MTDSADRTRILAQLAEEQTRQRRHHVTELSELHGRITELRDNLKATEQSYRTAYRRAITTGLLTGPQLRSLGLPPIDARRRSRTSPTEPADTSPVHQLHSNAS